MRKLIFKNLYSKKARKREVRIEEIVRENGCISKTVKKSLYFVKNVCTIESQDAFQKFVHEKKKSGEDKKRTFHVMKTHSDENKSDSVLCKAMGAFYIVVGQDIYNIVFLHSLRMEVEGPK